VDRRSLSAEADPGTGRLRWRGAPGFGRGTVTEMETHGGSMSGPKPRSRGDSLGEQGGRAASVTVHEEKQIERGWMFRVTWRGAEGGVEIELRLDWHDYEHWSHGAVSPSEVARAVVECAITGSATEAGVFRAGKRLDASTLRRVVPGLDEMVRERLG